MNIYAPSVALRLDVTDVNTIVAALSYVNHPAFRDLRDNILDQAKVQGIEL